MADYKHADLNEFRAIVRLTRDCELKYTSTGTALCKIGCVYSKKYKTKQGEEREETLFIDATLWGASAEFLAEHLTKGKAILLEGSLRQNSWENDEGEKRSKIEVNASRVQTLTWDGDLISGKASSVDEEEPEYEDNLPF